MVALKDLPDELLIAIADHVDPHDITALALTNPRWNNVCNRRRWHSVSIDSQRAVYRFLSCLTKARRSVADTICHLRLQNVDLKDNSFNIVLRRARCLRSFSIGNTSRISKSTLDKIASSWPNLISLSLPDRPGTQVPSSLKRCTLIPPCQDEQQQHHRHGKINDRIAACYTRRAQSSSRYVTLTINNNTEKK